MSKRCVIAFREGRDSKERMSSVSEACIDQWLPSIAAPRRVAVPTSAHHVAEPAGVSARRCPDFIAIGPGKCGTSWLYHLLSHHDGVWMSTAKETLYFETEYHRGPNWYRRFFEPGIARGLPCGEISNTYFFSDLAARRIASDLPACRLLTTLRNPIDRAFSHYLFELRNGSVVGDFETAIADRPDLLTRGLYHQHLERWDFAGRRLGIFLYDDLRADSIAFADKVLAHLNIDGEVSREIADCQVLGASRPRFRPLAKMAVRAAATVRSWGRPDWVTRIKTSWVADTLFRKWPAEERPRMDDQTRAKLADYFHEDVSALSRRLGRDLVTEWFAGVSQ